MSAFARARARQALAAAGIDATEQLMPLRDVTNEVWLSNDYLVRMNRRQDPRLVKETNIAPQLPPEVNYPEIVAYGGEEGDDYLVLRRPRGEVLARAWLRMSQVERTAAISQLAMLMRAVHTTPCPPGLPAIDDPPLLHSVREESPTTPIVNALEEASRLAFVEQPMINDARSLVRDLTLSLEPFDTPTLVHGDIHLENVIWDGERVSTLLDWKWARPAPADLDLDVLLRFCAHPYLFVAEDYRHVARSVEYQQVPWELGDAYPELFDYPRQFDRMRLYALAYDIRELLLYPPPVPVTQLPENHPYHRLVGLINGTSHLDVLAQAI